MERKVITICLLVQVIYVSFLSKCTIYFRGGVILLAKTLFWRQNVRMLEAVCCFAVKTLRQKPLCRKI